MIICDQFEGDSMLLAKKQHEVYYDALGILIGGCRTHFERACLIAGIAVEQSRWPAPTNIDHRTIQDAHDILAGAWRHQVRPPEPMLSSEALPRLDALSDWLQ
ncbi:hypothetical protein GRI38_13805 [Altererythrobacter aurantiacus]|uniref:Uncharacterized protein n=1 Tax=Parapontixanthobacter aurantiacus TaxID=1463599 RepID=A0A844ZI32_9SPHN|nr:hypothetical protein [Parapontixanthobacter aurantiacus]MXO87103.1 hypothetical protein [Parapontixanthobacter aurantiacus]